MDVQELDSLKNEGSLSRLYKLNEVLAARTCNELITSSRPEAKFGGLFTLD